MPAGDALFWATEHHDTANSGASAWDGPGEAAAVCHTQLTPRSLPGSAFYSSGVTGSVSAEGWWLGGDSTDTLFLLQDLPRRSAASTSAGDDDYDDDWQTFSINLGAFLGISSPATPFGIVAAPQSWAVPIEFAHRVFVASADGYVAAFDTVFCFTQGQRARRRRLFAAGDRSDRSGSSGSSGVWPLAPPLAIARVLSAAAGAAADAANPLASPLDGWLRGVAADEAEGLQAELDTSAAAHASAGATLHVSAAAGDNGGLWAVHMSINNLRDCPMPLGSGFCPLNSTLDNWEQCLSTCQANLSAGGGCRAFQYVPSTSAGSFKRSCFFRLVAGWSAPPNGYQANHVAGMLTSDAPGKDCLSWARKISAANAPSYGPPRLVQWTGLAVAVLLVTETHSDLDTGGVLHAYNARTGEELWTFAALVDNVSVGLKGVVPAQVNGGQLLLLAFGPRVIALDLAQCSVAACPEVGSIDSRTLFGGGDAFVSSVVVVGSAAFVHSSTGTLWKFALALSGEGTSSAACAFSLAFACRYSRGANSTCTAPTANSQRRIAGGGLEAVRTADYVSAPARRPAHALPALPYLLVRSSRPEASTSRRLSRSATSCTS